MVPRAASTNRPRGKRELVALLLEVASILKHLGDLLKLPQRFRRLVAQ